MLFVEPLAGSEWKRIKTRKEVTPGALKHPAASADVNHDRMHARMHTSTIKREKKKKKRKRRKKGGKMKRAERIGTRHMRDCEGATERERGREGGGREGAVDRETEGSWLLMTRR